MSLTRDLGQFVSDLSPNRVPEAAARIARTGFIDCVGVMFAGREEEPTRLLREVLQPAAGPGLFNAAGWAVLRPLCCIQGAK
jgi:2-methylcitrate dehydratase PrpD